MKLKIVWPCMVMVILSGCVSSNQINAEKKVGMVVTANPHATKAGADILRAGGSAVDAAIAIEAVLSLVEPQSSGFGGGGFMTHFDNQTKTVTIYDGREIAPAGATPTMFLDQAGEPIGFIEAKTSGLSTGVPGMVSMLKLAHEDHGKLRWGSHFDQAKHLAVEGFAISPRLFGMIERFGKYIPKTIEEGTLDAHYYFFDENNKPLPIGHLLKNSAYADTLNLIANDPASFYQGLIADQIIEQVTKSPRAGSMVKLDLSDYSAQRRSAVCTSYRETMLCGPPPPSSWVAVGMIMGLIEAGTSFPETGFSKEGAEDVANWTRFAEAQRLAYVDRDRFVADSAMVDVPIQGMLNKSYLAQRAKLISTDQAIDKVRSGNPWEYENQLKKVAGDDATYDIAGTTHFVVVDGDGNVVSLTASVESVFGSTRMAGGLFLNNQLTDFSFKPVDEHGNKIANSVAAGKRPRSSMSPTIVLDKGSEFLMASGSPGGNSIIAYTAKTLIGVLDWGLSPQQAVNLPNMVARGDKVRIEKERASDSLIAGLRGFGYQVKESAGENSGLSVVVRNAAGELLGGVDPRREGTIEMVELP